MQRKTDLTDSLFLETTHEEIALELGSSREVVSRLLKQLERIGRVRLGRNRVDLLTK